MSKGYRRIVTWKGWQQKVALEEKNLQGANPFWPLSFLWSLSHGSALHGMHDEGRQTSRTSMNLCHEYLWWIHPNSSQIVVVKRDQDWVKNLDHVFIGRVADRVANVEHVSYALYRVTGYLQSLSHPWILIALCVPAWSCLLSCGVIIMIFFDLALEPFTLPLSFNDHLRLEILSRALYSSF